MCIVLIKETSDSALRLLESRLIEVGDHFLIDECVLREGIEENVLHTSNRSNIEEVRTFSLHEIRECIIPKKTDSLLNITFLRVLANAEYWRILLNEHALELKILKIRANKDNTSIHFFLVPIVPDLLLEKRQSLVHFVLEILHFELHEFLVQFRVRKLRIERTRRQAATVVRHVLRFQRVQLREREFRVHNRLTIESREILEEILTDLMN